jgi:hypothetical protein
MQIKAGLLVDGQNYGWVGQPWPTRARQRIGGQRYLIACKQLDLPAVRLPIEFFLAIPLEVKT